MGRPRGLSPNTERTRRRCGATGGSAEVGGGPAGRYAPRLVNRRGCGGSPPVDGQDFLVDARDVADALEEGVRPVGHSFGAVAALIAAGCHPGRVRSPTVVEPFALTLVRERPDARAFVRRYAEIAARCYSPESFLEEYLVLIGTPPDSVAPALPATPTTSSGAAGSALGPR
ncbi:alpha/beta fold hydrolase [Streptomyces sp. NPDC003006]